MLKLAIEINRIVETNDYSLDDICFNEWID